MIVMDEWMDGRGPEIMYATSPPLIINSWSSYTHKFNLFYLKQINCECTAHNNLIITGTLSFIIDKLAAASSLSATK